MMEKIGINQIFVDYKYKKQDIREGFFNARGYQVLYNPYVAKKDRVEDHVNSCGIVTYKLIINTFFEILLTDYLFKGLLFIFPYRIGAIQFRKTRQRHYEGKSGKKFRNFHSHGQALRIAWRMKKSKCWRIMKFRMGRKTKRMVATQFKEDFNFLTNFL